MPVRALLHYALEVPDQTVGETFYRTFGLVDQPARDGAVHLRPGGLGRECTLALRRAEEAPPPPGVRRARRRVRGGAGGDPPGRRARGRSAARRARRRVLDPRSRRALRERPPGGRPGSPARPAARHQQPRPHPAPGGAGEPRPERPGCAPEARPRPPLHPRRRSPGRLLHAGARAEAVRPGEEHHRLHALHDRPPQPGVPRLERARVPPRVVPGRLGRRDRGGRGQDARRRAGRRAGGSAATSSAPTTSTTPATPGAALRSTTTISTSSPRSAPGSPGTFPEEDSLYVWGPPLPPEFVENTELT